MHVKSYNLVKSSLYVNNAALMFEFDMLTGLLSNLVVENCLQSQTVGQISC